MCGWLYLDTMHVDRANLIIWYLSIRRSDLETRHTIATIRISRSFLWYAMNVLIHVMQSWFFGVYGWSLQLSSLIKSWVQNRVSTMICESRFFILLAKTFETILYTTLPKLIGPYTEMSCGLFFFGIKAMCV